MHSDLDLKITSALRAMEATINTAMQEVKTLKERMNNLEKKMVQEGEIRNSPYMKALKKESDKLNRLSDSLAYKSKEAWQKYSELETICKAEGTEPSILNDVRLRCKAIEQIAADLLCYSLGH